jgi:small GTP-binding protein
MFQKRVCMLGGAAVGKTSLVARYVRNIFSEKYHSSIGVKVDKKVVSVGGQDVTLLLWDIYGDDEFQKIRASYVRGAAGCLLVVDGTRRSTLDKALALRTGLGPALGDVPFVLVLNKSDLADEWDVPDDVVDRLQGEGWVVVRASAKTGAGVEESLGALAGRLVSS